MYRVTCLLVIGFFLTGCFKDLPASTFQETPTLEMEDVPTPRKENEQCLPALFTSAYPRGEDVPSPEKLPNTISDDWIYVDEISDTATNGLNLSLALLHPSKAQDELWLYSKENNFLKEFFVYETETHVLKKGIPTPFSETYPNWQHLFLSADNSVWLGGMSNNEHEPLLYVFDEKTSAFIPIFDTGNILSNKTLYYVQVDANGTFWLLLNNHLFSSNNNEIVSFNPVTKEATVHFSQGHFTSLEVGPSNRIFWIEKTPEEDNVIEYLYETKEVHIHALPYLGNGSDFSGLYYDIERERLWVSDLGWFDLEDQGRWYTLFRSPIFVEYIFGQGIYLWTHPVIQFKSQDGLLWFTSNNRGNAWFDVETGQWCLFTNEPGIILEGSDNSLWMLFDGALYKR